LIVHLVRADPVAVSANGRLRPGEPIQGVQDFTVSIRFADGSLGVLLYGTAGAPRAGKELIEAHRGGRSGRIDDFRRLEVWGGRRGRAHRAWRPDKGHSGEAQTFAAVLRGEIDAPPTAGYVLSTQLTFAALRALEHGEEMAFEAEA